MGLLALERLLSVRRRPQTQPRGMPIVSVAKRKGSPCQQESSSQSGKRMRSSGPELPEDIWQYIHSLLPLRDAARASCVSRAFRCSWRNHPNLTFDGNTMGLKGQDYIEKVDQIMKKHSRSGVKTFEFEYYDSYYLDTNQLNSWLQVAVTPGIEELEIALGYEEETYNFPWLLLSSGSGGNSIRSLDLSGCTFRPMAGLGCLTRLDLCEVHITGNELGCLLSSSFALEELSLTYCSEIICLKIPCQLHRFVNLTVSYCSKLEVIENKAPNLCTVCIASDDIRHISIGDSLQVKDLEISRAVEFNLVYHARARLPASMPNLETLSITSVGEMFSTPSVPGKLLHLKNLNVYLEASSEGFSPNYDYFSLVFFLDACPILETFSLQVEQTRMKHVSVFEDPSDLRQMPAHRDGSIKTVEITGFCSAKSMVELTCHILENASSLECLRLDTILYGYENGLSDHKCGKCPRIDKHMIAEAHRALSAIERYVVGKVPSTVKLSVKKPCSCCHVVLE